MIGLALIGAGEMLRTRTILVRVRSIDPEKLRKAVAEHDWWGAMLTPAINMANTMPQLALETALPFIRGQLKDIGIDADLTSVAAADAPQASKGREVTRAIGIGLALGVGVALGGTFLYHRLKGV